MIFVSNKYSWIPLYIGILALFIYKYKWKGLILGLGLVLSVVVSDQFASGLIKPTVKRWRPCHDPELQSKVYLPNNHCGGDYGFISSHAANHFAIAAFLFFLFRNKFRWVAIFFIWAFLIAYSRVYLGVHYPGDVILGGMAGLLFGSIFLKYFQKYLKIEAN